MLLNVFSNLLRQPSLEISDAAGWFALTDVSDNASMTKKYTGVLIVDYAYTASLNKVPRRPIAVLGNTYLNQWIVHREWV